MGRAQKSELTWKKLVGGYLLELTWHPGPPRSSELQNWNRRLPPSEYSRCCLVAEGFAKCQSWILFGIGQYCRLSPESLLFRAFPVGRWHYADLTRP